MLEYSELQKINLKSSWFSNSSRLLPQFFENIKISGLRRPNWDVRPLGHDEGLLSNNLPAAEYRWLGKKELEGIVRCPPPAVATPPEALLYAPLTEACP